MLAAKVTSNGSSEVQRARGIVLSQFLALILPPDQFLRVQFPQSSHPTLPSILESDLNILEVFLASIFPSQWRTTELPIIPAPFLQTCLSLLIICCKKSLKIPFLVLHLHLKITITMNQYNALHGCCICNLSLEKMADFQMCSYVQQFVMVGSYGHKESVAKPFAHPLQILAHWSCHFLTVLNRTAL